MREIKFRAWDKIGVWGKPSMWEDKYIALCRFLGSYGDHGVEIIPPRYNVTLLMHGWQDESVTRKVPEEAILMQFIGLKDKNGKNIYESDILRVTDCFDEVTTQVVSWEDESACFYPFNNGEGYEVEPEDCEVIGNIYENPELLK